MQVFHQFDKTLSVPVGLPVRALVIAAADNTELPARLEAFGCSFDHETELYSGIAAVIDDPKGYALLVVDCDHAGEGADRIALRNLRAVQSRVPLLLLSKQHVTQIFPEDRDEAIRLRLPLSAVSLRVGCEHALRDRMIWQNG